MSQEELVQAYVEGQISRRTLVRRLVAAGLSVGAATSYANLLAQRNRAEASVARGLEYPDFVVRIRSGRLPAVRRKKKIKVRVRSTGSDKITVAVYFRDRFLGAVEAEFFGVETRDFVIPLKVNPLRGRKRARVTAIVRRQNSGTERARHTRVLKPKPKRKRRRRRKK